MKKVFIICVCYLYKLTSTIVFKLVNSVLVMRPLTDHVYFVGIVSKIDLICCNMPCI